MNVSQLKRALVACTKHKIVPFVWGTQGVGKTTIVGDTYEAMGYKMVHLLLASQEPGDLIGLLHKDEKTGTVSHLPPKWFPFEGKVCVFLDELNRAPMEVIQVMFPFILSGTIHTHQAGPEVVIVAAGNYNTGQFNVTDTSDAAWMSRFCHLDFEPSLEDFVTYADKAGKNTISDFIRAYPEMLRVEPKEKLNLSLLQPDPRAWLNQVFPLESEDINDCRYEVVAGIVGPTAAAAYMTHRTCNLETLKAKDVLDNYPSYRPQVQKLSDPNDNRFDLLDRVSNEIVKIMEDTSITDSQLSNYRQFLLDIPLEMSLKIIDKIQGTPKLKRKGDLLNDEKFVKLFEQQKLLTTDNKHKGPAKKTKK